MAEEDKYQETTEARSFLVFELDGMLLALDALAVREILRLMEITPLEEAPPYLPGVVNLRGKILPVLDLGRRFGRERQRYNLTDGVIITDTGPTEIGIVVNDVREVITVSSNRIESSPLLSLDHKVPPRFVTRVARVGDRIVMILNHEALLTDSDPRDGPLDREWGSQKTVSAGYFCPEAGPEERAAFHERARIAMQLPADEMPTGATPVAVVGMNEEYFGVDLELVLEFADIHGLTPIPCSPAHIIGNMNLRGNIVTLVDIRGLLDLPQSGISETAKVIVAGLGDLTVGVAVDDVFDIAFLKPADIWPVPSAVQKMGERFLKGTAAYAGKAMTILNLANILASENLTVAEEA